MTPFTSTLNTSSHNRPYSDQAPRPVTMIVSPAPRDSKATTAAGPKQPASFHIFLSGWVGMDPRERRDHDGIGVV